MPWYYFTIFGLTLVAAGGERHPNVILAGIILGVIGVVVCLAGALA